MFQINTINEDYFFKYEISLTKIHGGGEGRYYIYSRIQTIIKNGSGALLVYSTEYYGRIYNEKDKKNFSIRFVICHDA